MRKFVIESAFGPIFAIAGAGLLLLIIAAFLWDVVAAAVDRLRERFGRGVQPEAAEPIHTPEPISSRRTARSRDRHSARVAARRDAIHAKHADADHQL